MIIHHIGDTSNIKASASSKQSALSLLLCWSSPTCEQQHQAYQDSALRDGQGSPLVPPPLWWGSSWPQDSQRVRLHSSQAMPSSVGWGGVWPTAMEMVRLINKRENILIDCRLLMKQRWCPLLYIVHIFCTASRYQNMSGSFKCNEMCTVCF